MASSKMPLFLLPLDRITELKKELTTMILELSRMTLIALATCPWYSYIRLNVISGTEVGAVYSQGASERWKADLERLS